MLALTQKMPTNPDCRLLIISTTSNLTAMQLLDIDRVFNLKLNIPLLNERECEKILRASVGIKDQPIRKIIQFQ